MCFFPIDDDVVFDDTESDDEEVSESEDDEQVSDSEIDDPELDGVHELDGEIKVVVPEDENLDDDGARWEEINIPPIDSSMVFEADKELTSLAEPIEGDVQGLEEFFLPFLFGFFLRALRKSLGITV